MSQSVEDKVTAARTRLLLDHPFLGALVLRLPAKAADKSWCRSVATDARSFYYNPEYVQAIHQTELEFMLAHEALHCALSHFNRRGHRNLRRWDIACDLAINPILLEEGLRPPPDMIIMLEFAGMSAEEIYPLVDDDMEENTPDQHVYDQQPRQGQSEARQDRSDGGGGQGESQGSPPPPLSLEEREQLAQQWRQRLAGAAQQAAQAGKLSGVMQRLVDSWLQPVLPWRALLARYVSQAGREDFSYMRTSRREGEAILPSLRSSHIDVLVVVDSSGSIADQEMREFLSEVNALKGQIRARITLLACDSDLAPGCPWIYESWEEVQLPATISGGGGTDFNPPFVWLREQGRQPDLMLYFTDADGTFPQQAPPCPVVWLVKGRKEVPWGQRIQLN